MTNFLTDILVHKKGNLFELFDNQLEFSPYIIQRILSASSPTTCNILNKTTNGKFKYLTNEQIYKLWVLITPKNNAYINLPKRKQKETFNELENKAIDFLAKKHKISKREVIEYVKELELDLGDVIKLFK